MIAKRVHCLEYETGLQIFELSKPLMIPSDIYGPANYLLKNSVKDIFLKQH